VVYDYLEKDEYQGIPLCRIEENDNGLPFLITRRNHCNVRQHRHAYVQIAYISKGRLQHVLNRTVFDVFRGDIFIIPPFVPHHFIESGSEPYEIIEFEFVPEFINERFSRSDQGCHFMDFAYLEPFLVAEKEVRPRLNLSGSVQLEVERILNEVIVECERQETDYQLLVKALLQQLLIIVSRAFSRSLRGSEGEALFDRHRAALNQAINYIHQHYTGAVSVDEAARVAMLSQSYFRYLFKQLFQKSFIEYVNDLRIARAGDMLKSRQDLRIVDVCHAVGFNNVNYFNRVFRTATGLSPMAYRRAVSLPGRSVHARR
jgi:AraC-like DNA-binding protein/mannose-6-phosphate isomerase-like protein (cupin superfamily)